MPSDKPCRRINITIDENTLALIDAGAAKAGESRSKYLAEAAAHRAGKELGFLALTQGQREVIAHELRRFALVSLLAVEPKV